MLAAKIAMIQRQLWLVDKKLLNNKGDAGDDKD
jgi:hypothetical protein